MNLKYNLMKNLYYSILLLMVVASSVSCDDMLDTPAPSLSDEVYFSNDGAALNALSGAYDPIGWYDHMQINEWAIGDVVSDDAEKGGENDADQADIHAIATFNANAENGLIREKWQAPYLGINRANKLIEGITDNDNISEGTRKRVNC